MTICAFWDALLKQVWECACAPACVCLCVCVRLNLIRCFFFFKKLKMQISFFVKFKVLRRYLHQFCMYVRRECMFTPHSVIHNLNPEVLCTRSRSVPQFHLWVPMGTTKPLSPRCLCPSATEPRGWWRERGTELEERERRSEGLSPLSQDKGLSDWGSPARVGLIFLPILLIYFLIPPLPFVSSLSLSSSTVLNCNPTWQTCRWCVNASANSSLVSGGPLGSPLPCLPSSRGQGAPSITSLDVSKKMGLHLW